MPFTKETAGAAAAKSAAKRGAKTTNQGNDERLVRSSAPAVRGDRDGSLQSRDEAVEALSDAELDQLMASEFEQTALPTPPLIPGWHLCWLTTESKYDPIAKRERLGYVPVRQSEVAGFDPSNGTAVVEPQGLVRCNEMVLYKIPEARYQAIMRYFHHRKPMEEEATIVANIKAKSQQGSDSSGRGGLRDAEDDGGTLSELETGVQYAQRVNPTFN